MIELHDAQVTVPAPPGAARGTPSTTIVQPTTLRLHEQRISIIGANGSGKSTLARLLNGLIVPSSGSVRVQDHRAPASPWLDTRRDGAVVRRLVGFMFTDPAAQLIMPTVSEDIELSLRRTHRDPAERRAAALAVLQRFGLEGRATQSVHSLSGGQQQLLALAAVLATDPATVIADEPTTLLDLRNSRRIADELFALPQQLIVITHDLELAARAARTLVVDGGAVVFDGDPAAAIAHYRALVEQP